MISAEYHRMLNEVIQNLFRISDIARTAAEYCLDLSFYPAYRVKPVTALYGTFEI